MMVIWRTAEKGKERKAGRRDPCSKVLQSFPCQWKSCSTISIPKYICSCGKLVFHEIDVAGLFSESFTLHFSFKMKISAATLKHFQLKTTIASCIFGCNYLPCLEQNVTLFAYRVQQSKWGFIYLFI